MSETETTAAERQLRLQAAQPVYRRLVADGQAVPDLAPFLATIKDKLFRSAFDVSALWREHRVGAARGIELFAPLKSTPKAYLTDCRLSVAARLLAHTDLEVGRISELVGYATRSSFFRAFRPWAGGRTPLKYRKNPDPDPEPWCTPIDLAKVQAALNGELSRKEGLEVCRRLHVHMLEFFEPGVGELLALARAAVDTADFETALHHLERAATHPERDAFQTEIDALLAVATHCRGTILTLEGDVDRAYDDLALARGCYAQAGALEPRLEKRRRRLESQVSCTTDRALTSALCSDCRRALALGVGESLRRHLRRALELVPLDLPWFDVCCDQCYRVVWKAFKLARHGLLDDAYQAWWLAAHVDLGDLSAPKTAGRVIAALAEVDSFGWSSQEDRLKMCDIALSAAETVRRPELLHAARFWRGNVLRALARFSDARKELQWQGQVMNNPWVRALHGRFLGMIEQATNNFKKALVLLEISTATYKSLDPHLAGLLMDQQGRVYVDVHDYQAAIRLYRQASTFFDGRRCVEPSPAEVPINLARALAANGDLDEATAELARCRYDRSTYPHIAAVEVFTKGCISLLSEQARDARVFFLDAQSRFERLGESVYAGLAATHCVEAYSALGHPQQASTAARAGIRLFEAAGCPAATLEAAARLQALLASGATVTTIAPMARRLAMRHGGWLPPGKEQG